MKTNDLRKSFIDFFKTKQHREVKSSSLVPDDPTLLFTSAGMVQFKDQFLGIGIKDYRRAVSCQKCWRTGDIENVGRTPRHHTFFEMLGNFSFGDYFKKEAITWGWEYVREELKIPEKDIWVGVHTEDKEAFEIWKRDVGFPEKKIVLLEDNWWGPVDPKGGVCGPDSEMHLDMGGGCGKKDCKPGCDCGRFVEFWNLVFQQYNQDGKGKRKPLAKPGVDTGMGLERTAAILQGVASVFETDEFAPLVKEVESLAGGGKEEEHTVSRRIVADHVRSACFCIAEGLTPGNEGREYVLRRVIRRGARHGVRLGASGTFLHKLVPAVISGWGSIYPELRKNQDRAVRILKGEEERFVSILADGTVRLQELIDGAKKAKKKEVAGQEVFRLYDTHGFPDDLAEEMITEAGLTFDRKVFERAMSDQRDRARSAWKGSGDMAVAEELLAKAKGIKATEFVGYEKTSEKAKVVVGGVKMDYGAEKDTWVTVLDKTPFYPESGGQVGDKGVIKAVKGNAEFEVANTARVGDSLIVHFGKWKNRPLNLAESVEAIVDLEKREEIAANHTATHLLHQALQEVLGSHVEQAGSLVEPARLRFDFSHHGPLSARETSLVEARVNELVRMNLEVKSEEKDYKKALETGAKAFFQDKYGDKVRIVSIGEVSLELCGGTHLKRSGDIGFFKLVGQSAVAAGVRRIEAVTGKRAVEEVQNAEAETRQLCNTLGVNREGLAERIKQLAEKIKSLEKGEKKKRSLDIAGRSKQLIDKAREVGGVKLVSECLEDVSVVELRTLGDELKGKLKQGVIVLAAKSGAKASLLIMVAKSLAEEHPAGALMKAAVAVMDGKGGGRPDMAQGGGDAAKLDAAFKAVEDKLKG